MPFSVDLGKKLESTVSKLIAKGRYNSKSEVLREGVRLVEEREKALMRLDAALARGIGDIKAGRVYSSQEVRAEVHKRMREVAARQAKKRA
ncbi:MAG: type II toxin-antitoxin system ParD family antitoxin [Rhizomicrobium sp.]